MGNMLLPTRLGGGRVPVSSAAMRMMVLAAVPIVKLCQLIYGEQPIGTDAVYDNRSSEDKDTEMKNAKGAKLLSPVNSVAWRKAEIPSANVHASARALAKVAATVVEGGAICRNDAAHAQTEACSEQRIISKEGIRTANADAVSKVTTGIARSRTTYFSNAGWTAYKNMQDGCGREGYVGWMGAGGSAFQWHPEQRIGFGYAMNQMELTPSNERAAALQKVVLDCAVKHAAGM